jgi:DNA-binding response OmpR family regulator
MGARILVVDDSSTIRKLVSSILARHDYDATTAADGLSALEKLRGETFDLVLVDLVMPHMSGEELCREIRADQRLAGVPIVLMSARAERLRGRLTSETGAAGAISKPFDARALVAVVEGALQKVSASNVWEVDAADLMDDIPVSYIEARDSQTTLVAEPYPQRNLASEIAERLAATLAPALAELPGNRRSDPAEIAAIVGRALSSPAASELAALFERFAIVRPDGEALRGSLEVIPLAEILQVLQLQRQTGTCHIDNGAVEVTIFFRDGMVDVARGRGAADEFRLGRYFAEEGLLSRVELDQLVQSGAGAGKGPLGQRLLHFGLISQEDLRRALMRQTSELLYEALRWPAGHFGFSPAEPEGQEESARLGLPVAAIVMEGFRRVDEWRVIEQSIRFDEVLLRDEVALDALGSEKLSRTEQQLLDAIDGRRTVREILSAVDIGSFDACKTLYQFLQSRLVRTRAA